MWDYFLPSSLRVALPNDKCKDFIRKENTKFQSEALATITKQESKESCLLNKSNLVCVKQIDLASNNNYGSSYHKNERK